MKTLAEIMAAIEKLSPEDREKLEAALHPRIDDEWDSPAAAPAGRPDKRSAKAAGRRATS